ncbi:hypothetical protein SK1NUM_06980 [Arachnia rubra]|nr:hypothetical protein SK1NUM_06980 [Arachnia rubra]
MLTTSNTVTSAMVMLPTTPIRARWLTVNSRVPAPRLVGLGAGEESVMPYTLVGDSERSQGATQNLDSGYP